MLQHEDVLVYDELHEKQQHVQEMLENHYLASLRLASQPSRTSVNSSCSTLARRRDGHPTDTACSSHSRRLL